MHTIVVVLGYGCHMTPEMDAYLSTVVRYINTHPVTLVITTGGFTNQSSAPGVSEAGMMKASLLNRGVLVPVECDEVATTTNENLEAVSRMVPNREGRRKLVIFCDRIRRFKVRLLARLILGEWVEVRTHALTTGRKSAFLQYVVATPADIASTVLPCLARIEKTRVQERMRRS